MHEPLSRRLAQILETQPGGGAVSVNQLLDRTGGRGLFLVVILLCLPFVAPVSVPGMSTPFGVLIAVMASRFARGKPPHVPGRLGARPMPPRLQRAVLGGGLKVLRLLEKLIRPRRTGWMGWPLAQKANAALIVFMALMLALPLPPIPPFTNALPSYAIILIAASMMEEDGVLIWAGYAVAAGTVAYFAAWAGVIAVHLTKWFDALTRLLERST